MLALSGSASALAAPPTQPSVSAPTALAQVLPTHYKTLPQPQQTDSSGKIEVIEFFWYECSHCNEFEPVLEAWQKKLPKDVVLRRVPVAFRDTFTDQQKLYYTLETLGRLSDMQSKVFQDIHTANNRLRKPAEFAALAEKNGIDTTKFYDTFQSFSVQAKTKQAKLMTESYQIGSVPTLAVNGQYTTTASLAGGSHAAALIVVDALIDKVRKAKATPPASPAAVPAKK
ncbi:MAG: thiol:disulfide interchange protein DsbA/DsbL [Burkholderiaceae bacterium]